MGKSQGIGCNALLALFFFIVPSARLLLPPIAPHHPPGLAAGILMDEGLVPPRNL